MIPKFFLATVFLLTIFLCNCYAFDDGDFQYWNAESISWEFSKSWKLKIEEEFRFGDSITDFYYQYSDLGLSFVAVEKYLDIGVNYRQIFEEKQNKWLCENRPHLNATAKFDIYKFAISDRNRFELRHREKTSDGWRYRNKFMIKSPKMTPFDIQPYIADEIFVDFIKGELNVNRLYGGICFKLFKNLKGEIYYLWQAKKRSDNWLDFNVLGTKLTLSF